MYAREWRGEKEDRESVMRGRGGGEVIEANRR
jgi:hypothetical protein